MDPVAVVHLVVEPLDAAGHAVRIDERVEIEAFVAGQQPTRRQSSGGGESVVPIARQQVVEREIETQQSSVAGDSAVCRDDERQGPDQMGRDAAQRPALSYEPAQRGDVAGLQRPNAAVQGLRAVERGAAAEVGAVDNGGAKAAQGRIPGCDRAVYAPADDEEVEGTGRQRREVSAHFHFSYEARKRNFT